MVSCIASPPHYFSYFSYSQVRSILTAAPGRCRQPAPLSAALAKRSICEDHKPPTASGHYQSHTAFRIKPFGTHPYSAHIRRCCLSRSIQRFPRAVHRFPRLADLSPQRVIAQIRRHDAHAHAVRERPPPARRAAPAQPVVILRRLAVHRFSPPRRPCAVPIRTSCPRPDCDARPVWSGL